MRLAEPRHPDGIRGPADVRALAPGRRVLDRWRRLSAERVEADV